MVSKITNGESGTSVRRKLNDGLQSQYLTDLVISSMVGNNKMVNVPWKVCPKWSAGEVIMTGVRRINDGREWACIIGGTTSAAPTVAGSAGNLFTDDSVIWENMAPNTFSTDLANGPTYSLSASAPSLTKFYTNAASTWAHGATYAIKNDAWFNQLGFYGGLTTNGIGDFATARGPIAFWTDAAQIVVAFAGSNSTGTYVEIDGRLITTSMIMDTTTGGATNYMTINLPTTLGKHFVVIWRKTNQGSYIRGVYVPVTATCWADKSRSTQLKFHFVTDSQGECELYKGSNWDRTLQNVFGAYLGAYNLQSDPGGGTGFYAGGTNNYSATARIAKITGFLPDVICAWTSNNDTDTSQTNLTDAINTWYNSVRAIVPDAWIFISGQMNRNSAETTLDQYTKAAVLALQATDSRIFFLNTTGDAGGPWQTGTGKINAPVGDGNADIYTGDDGLHFCQRGKEQFGRRWYEAFRNAVLTI